MQPLLSKNPTDTKNMMIVLITSLGVFVSNLDISIVNIALPTLASDYGVSIAAVSRIVLVYLLSLASLLLVFGRLADARGSERVFKVGFTVFTLASIFCAFSWSINSLTIFRFIQGIGGAMIEATAAALILLYLPAEIRGRAFGINVVFAGVGFAAGSPIGGLLIQYLSWRWIFLVNVPVGIMVLILASKYLHRQADDTYESFDIPGAVLSFLGFAALLTALNFAQSGNISATNALFSFLPAILLLTTFLFYEKRAPKPLLDISLFKNTHLSIGLTGYMLAVLVVNGVSFLFPFYFESVRSFSPDRTGLLLMILPLMTIIISPFSGYLSDKESPRILCVSAMLGLVLSGIMLILLKSDSSILFVITALIIFGFSIALYYTADVTLVMSHAPDGKEGILSALIAIFGSVGAALGISLYSLVLSLTASQAGPGSNYTDMTSVMIAEGFKNGAILGLMICMLGLVFSLLAREKKL